MKNRDLQRIIADVRIVGRQRENHIKVEEKIEKLGQEILSDHPNQMELFNKTLHSAQREGIINEIRRYGTWSNSDDARKKIGQLKKEFLEKFPENIKEFNKNLDSAKRAGKVLNDCFKLGAAGIKSKPGKQIIEKFDLDLKNIDSSFLLEKQKETLTEIGFGYLGKKAEDQFKRGKLSANRHKQERNRSKNGKAAATVRPRQQKNPVLRNKILLTTLDNQPQKAISPTGELHANDIRNLSPHTNWTLLLDETGSDFSASAQTRSDIKAQLGRMVSLLLPDANCLPQLPTGWHAVDVENVNEIDSVLQNILNTECGVFGLSVKSLHPAPGERWAQLAQAVIEWVVRLLPIDGATAIEVLIEQRGTYGFKQNWQLMADVIKHSLAQTLQDRAKKIDLQIRTITKEGHPYNGYVDSVAYTWAQSTQWSRDRLRDSGLEGTCLLSVDADLLLRNWNTYLLGGDMNGEVWDKLVSSPDADSAASLASSLLDSLGNECRANPSLWSRYLQQSMRHAASKAIRLPQLAKQIAWLNRFTPVNMSLPAPLELAWLTIKLANSNHQGETEISWLERLGELSDRLYVEDAPLVCYADLHRAVQATNRFDFNSASEALHRWQDCNPAIPGLRYWAQVQSSMGQHAAFIGDPERAVSCFDKALEAFEQLSNGGVAECKQTGIYKAIVMMDDKRVDDNTCRNIMGDILGNLEQASERFSLSNSVDEKYLHHLFLRYLVFRGDRELQRCYLSQNEDWLCGTGHPWPLIQGYRAILLRSQHQEKALESMLDGAVMAFDRQQGPTVQFIGAGLRAIAHAWGDLWPKSDTILNELCSALPLTKTRIELIRNFIARPYDERKFLKEILPFNFR